MNGLDYNSATALENKTALGSVDFYKLFTATESTRQTILKRIKLAETFAGGQVGAHYTTGIGGADARRLVEALPEFREALQKAEKTIEACAAARPLVDARGALVNRLMSAATLWRNLQPLVAAEAEARETARIGSVANARYLRAKSQADRVRLSLAAELGRLPPLVKAWKLARDSFRGDVGMAAADVDAGVDKLLASLAEVAKGIEPLAVDVAPQLTA